MSLNTNDNTTESTTAPDTFHLHCTINGQPIERDVEVDRSLLSFLRDDLGLTGTKGSCLEGECGSCTVLIDGVPFNSCVTLAGRVNGRSVTTIEGFAQDDKPAILQEKFLETGSVQCGYCSPGLILTAYALLQANPEITEEELIKGMEANICRCTGYTAIIEALRRARREMLK
ncbi:MAG: (2Fe-2S)-binding protein [Phycisphaerae bacterium]|nr:(2Fe-2S)-binding protein [Phycisphaerae bacterium]